MKSFILSRSGLVILTMLLIIILATRFGALEEASFSIYDKIRMLEESPVSKVLVVAIDSQSLATIGDYPIPYQTHVRLLENLISTGVELVGYVDLPALNRGYAEQYDALASPPVNRKQQDKLTREFRDQQLIVSGIPFVSESKDDMPPIVLPAKMLQNSLPGNQSISAITARPAYSIADVTDGPAANYTSILVDNNDGKTVRSTPLFIETNGLLIPTLTMQMYLRANNMMLSDVTITDGKSITIAGRKLIADETLRVWPKFYTQSSGTSHSVEVVSYQDVLHGVVPADKLDGKIALLGITARGLTPTVLTPAESPMPPVMVAANALIGMLAGQIISMPAWSSSATMVFLVLIAVLLLWLFRQSLKTRIAVTAALVLILLGIEVLVMLMMSTWLNMYPPVLFLLAGFLASILIGDVHTRSEKPAAMSGEVHRRVGLASQKRGELDAAFESFRKCPLDNSIMVLLFYLALDFENEGRFDRAVAVYQYMESFNPHFKDLQDRLEKARIMVDTVLIDQNKIVPAANTAVTSLDSTEVSEGDSPGQQLGRYSVEHEIGKGAMGMVYKGRDPKINRTVAIKTLNLKREFDKDEQASVLDRFFHEAEAAGRLHHPHIVTIYDAGQHNDLAYIAMEYLTGSDLRVYTKQGTLLPPLTVVKMGMKLAGALAYAHTRDIIHRDIKAANVMYDPATGQLKITDFGIARLTDSRRTKTGMVLGTPSSMSPEQLRGKKLDGRTDLYSLGILMFQLLTGQLPYKGESLTQLMYKITKEPPPDLFALRPDLKENGECIRDILDKLLQKDADDRYQDGKKLARDLLNCAKTMTGKSS
jgi:CHASE2 domain-containing sensor protein/tRNA A-37 threonylcarbamoyl transferase component Bud32